MEEAPGLGVRHRLPPLMLCATPFIPAAAVSTD